MTDILDFLLFPLLIKNLLLFLVKFSSLKSFLGIQKFFFIHVSFLYEKFLEHS